MKSMYQAVFLLIVITLISGILYPLAVTEIGQLLWSEKSHGSLIKNGDVIIGSELIAQPFTKPHYFWPRPSATNFNTLPSGGSNLGPTSAELAKQIKTRRKDLSTANDISPADIPMDLLTTSSSGLDPHISKAAAKLQAKRIAKARNLDKNGLLALNKIIDDQEEIHQFRILGEKRINVLLLNLALDQKFKHR